MTNFQDLLELTRAQIQEVDTAEAEERLKQSGVVALDVREDSEFEHGVLSSAVHIPREQLESQIGQKVPDIRTSIVVYCAGGARSAFAAKTLGDLGYQNVVSMAGGFEKWKKEGRDYEIPMNS